MTTEDASTPHLSKTDSAITHEKLAKTIVVDVGSYAIKAGTCTDAYRECPVKEKNGDEVRAVVNVGARDSARAIPGIRAPPPRMLLGSIAKAVSPIRRGTILHEESLGKLLDRVYRDCLGIEDVSERRALISTPVEASNRDRTWYLEHHFEKLGMQSVSMEDQCSLMLYSVGVTTGFAINVGHGLTQTAPIYDGAPLPEGVVSMHRAGIDLDTFMTRLLAKEGHSFSDVSSVRRNKEKHARVAARFNAEARDCMKAPELCELPDGSEIRLSVSRVMCPEMLFRPEIAGDIARGPGLHKIVANSFQSCPIDTCANLAACFVVGGGTTRMKGFSARLKKEISDAMGDRLNMDFKFDASSYIGGQISAALMPESSWLTKGGYAEHGCERFLRKVSGGGAV